MQERNKDNCYLIFTAKRLHYTFPTLAKSFSQVVLDGGRGRSQGMESENHQINISILLFLYLITKWRNGNEEDYRRELTEELDQTSVWSNTQFVFTFFKIVFFTFFFNQQNPPKTYHFLYVNVNAFKHLPWAGLSSLHPNSSCGFFFTGPLQRAVKWWMILTWLASLNWFGVSLVNLSCVP